MIKITEYSDDFTKGRNQNLVLDESFITLEHNKLYGVRITPSIDISVDENYDSSLLTAQSTIPTGSSITIKMQSSGDDGLSWSRWTIASLDKKLPLLQKNKPLSKTRIRFKIILQRDNLAVEPQIDEINIAIYTKPYGLPPLEIDRSLGEIQDLQTYAIDNFDEKIKIYSGVDGQLIKNKYALWQGVVGELKSRKGECKGIGQELYGSDIWQVKGENMNSMLLDQIDFYIKELRPKYEEIEDIELIDAIFRQEGKLHLFIKVYSIFGEIEGDFVVG